jgi:hypothetical protein
LIVTRRAERVSFEYSILGLALRANLAMPGLAEQASHSLPSIDVRLGESPVSGNEAAIAMDSPPVYASCYTIESGEPIFRMWIAADGAYRYIKYHDGMEFWFDRECARIWCRWAAPLNLEDAASYLLGPILGLLLRFRGVTCLHGSAVGIGGRAIAFVGPPGVGKSTTAAALGERGCEVLSDDVVALREHPSGETDRVDAADLLHVIPAVPYLSLWPESVTMLYGSPYAAPCFSSNWEKRRLGDQGGKVRFANRSLPLGIVYILDSRGPEPAPYIEELAPRTALIGLIGNTCATDIIDSELRAKEFGVLGCLVNGIPVRRVRPHQDPSRLGALCDLILQDVLQSPSGRGSISTTVSPVVEQTTAVR